MKLSYDFYESSFDMDKVIVDIRTLQLKKNIRITLISGIFIFSMFICNIILNKQLWTVEYFVNIYLLCLSILNIHFYFDYKNKLKNLKYKMDTVFTVAIPETYEFEHCVGITESFNIVPENIDIQKLRKMFTILKTVGIFDYKDSNKMFTDSYNSYIGYINMRFICRKLFEKDLLISISKSIDTLDGVSWDGPMIININSLEVYKKIRRIDEQRASRYSKN